MLCDPGREAVGGASARERAARLEVGENDDALGVQNLGRLRHEVNAREANHVGLRFRGGLGELQGITDQIGDVLDIALLVVVRENDRVALFFEALDLIFQIVGACVGHHFPGNVGRPSQLVKHQGFC